MNSTSVDEEQRAVSPDNLLRQLRWRYATKKFDPTRKIDQKDWETLEEAIVLSPSSYGLQPWKFIVVTNSHVREQLRAVSWNQPQVVDASHLLVFAIKKDLCTADVERYIERIAEVRQAPLDSLGAYKQMMNGFVRQAGKGLDINAWSARQLYIALGLFLTSAAMLGIDACPMEGIDGAKYDEVLGLDKKGFHTLCVATAGYRAADDDYARAPKVRFAKTQVIEHLV